MNTTHNTKTKLLRLATAAVATPALLFAGAGTAQADGDDSDLSYPADSGSSYTSSPDSSYTSSPDSSYTSSPDSSYTSSPDSSYTSSPDSSYTSSPDSSYTSSPDPGVDVAGDGTATVGGPLGPNFPSSGLWQGPSAQVPQSAADVWFPDGPPEIRESLPPAPPATSQTTPWCNAACHQDYDDPVMPPGTNPFAPMPPRPLNTAFDPNYAPSAPYDGPSMGPATMTPEQEEAGREWEEGRNALREGRLMEHLFGPVGALRDEENPFEVIPPMPQMP
jgi:hypothetical protein